MPTSFFRLPLITIIFSIVFCWQLPAQQTLDIGQPAPPITITEWLLNTPGDTSLHKKYIVLEFWATWCKPCLDAVPHLNDLQAKLNRSDVQFLSMTDEPPEVAREVFDKVDFKSAVVTDEYGRTHRAFGDGRQGLAYYPLLVLIDQQHIVRWFGNPHDLTMDMLSDFVHDRPIDHSGKTRKKPNVASQDQLIKPLRGRITFDQYDKLFKDDSVTWFVHLTEVLTNSEQSKVNGFYAVATKSGVFPATTLDELFRTLFPHEKFVFPDAYRHRLYNFAHINKYPDEDMSKQLKKELYTLLGLQAIESKEPNTTYQVSVADESRLVPDVSGKFTGFTNGGFETKKFTKCTLRKVMDVLIQETDSDWVYKGKDQTKYSFELHMSSEETIIQSLEEYGLRVKPNKGRIQVTRFEEK
jgi:thiol-disulfide isomerase/thioredoxin